MTRFFYNLLVLACFALFGVAGYDYYRFRDGPLATFEDAEREFPALAVGENQVRIRLHNPTGHVVRVVGASGCCGQNCGFNLKREIPFDIPPGTSEELECILEAIQPGHVAYQFQLYLDDLGLREITMAVSGTAKNKD